MTEVIVIEGPDLEYLRTLFKGHPHEIWKLSFMFDDGLKVKVNENMWTAPLGEVTGTDPILAALRNLVELDERRQELKTKLQQLIDEKKEE